MKPADGPSSRLQLRWWCSRFVLIQAGRCSSRTFDGRRGKGVEVVGMEAPITLMQVLLEGAEATYAIAERLFRRVADEELS